MAIGTLGQSAPSATTNTVVYTVTQGTTGTVSINVVNRSNTASTVRLAISDGTSPLDKDYIEYETTVPAYGVLERTGIVMSSGKRLIAYCGTANFSVNVYGFEE